MLLQISSLAKDVILARTILTTCLIKLKNLISCFFQTLVKQYTNKHSPHDLTVNNRNPLLRQDACFRPEPVYTDTVTLTIENLKEKKAVGSYGIPLRFLKDALLATIPYTTCINNTTLATGIFPKAWKYTVVVPLFKSGDINSVNNYGPISLLPIISKILKKIVANLMLHYLESNKLLINSQRGFCPKLSTETTLTVITNKMYKNRGNKSISLLTLCDLSKAFDSVSYSIHLWKCTNLNIDSFWFKDYVSNTTQSAHLNNTVSSVQNTANGCLGAQYLPQYYSPYTLMTLPITLPIICLYNALTTHSSSTRALSTTLTFLSDTMNQLSLDSNVTF